MYSNINEDGDNDNINGTDNCIINDDSVSTLVYRVIAAFGHKTCENEQIKILKSKYADEFKYNSYFLNFKSIINNWDKMYNFGIKVIW